MGQLLVVVHHTDNSPSLCYEPELIPDLYRHLLGATVIEIWDQIVVIPSLDETIGVKNG